MPGKSPSTVKESLWQMPQASTLIRTWLGPGSGSGLSTSSKAPFGSRTCIARMDKLLGFDLSALAENMTRDDAVEDRLHGDGCKQHAEHAHDHFPGRDPDQHVDFLRDEEKAEGDEHDGKDR